MIDSLVVSLILTIIFEVVYTLLNGIRNQEGLSTIIWVNCLTNPIVVFLTFLSLEVGDVAFSFVVILFLEIMAVLIEGYVFKNDIKSLKVNPYLFSLYLNTFSFTCGSIFNFIFEIFIGG